MIELDWKNEFLDIIIFSWGPETAGTPMQQAMTDMRLIDAARFALTGAATATVHSDDRFIEALAQVGYDYGLDPDDMVAVIDVTQQRIESGAL